MVIFCIIVSSSTHILLITIKYNHVVLELKTIPFEYHTRLENIINALSASDNSAMHRLRTVILEDVDIIWVCMRVHLLLQTGQPVEITLRCHC